MNKPAKQPFSNMSLRANEVSEAIHCSKDNHKIASVGLRLSSAECPALLRNDVFKKWALSLFLVFLFIYILASNCWAGDVTYDFSSGAGSNKWAYEVDSNERPGTSGPTISGETEFTSYTEINSSNGTHYVSTSTAVNQYRLNHFKFTISEDTETMTNIYVEWEGFGDNENHIYEAYLYIWNYGSTSWEAVGNHTSSSDQVINNDYFSSFGNYIDANDLHILLASPKATTGAPPNWADIYTDYLRVVVTTAVADSTAPDAITTLEATQGDWAGSIKLSWLAPGDDGDTGALSAGSRFKIQYSSFTPVVWSTGAATVTISTSSVNPGDPQSWSLDGLLDGVTYFIRLWTKDEQNNWSGVSNGATDYAQIESFTSGAPNNFLANKFQITATGYNNITLSSRKVSYRFIAQSSKTLRQARFFLALLNGSPELEVEIQTDDGSADHLPSGSLAWAGAEDTSIFPEEASWVSATLDTPGALVQGTTYHIVIKPVFVDASNNSSPIYTDPVNTSWINESKTNAGRGVCFASPNWTAQSHEPVYILGFNDSTYEGNPYSGFSDVTIAGETNYAGETFKVSQDIGVDQVHFLVKKTGAPTDSLYYEIRRVLPSDLFITSGTLAIEANVGTSYAWKGKPMTGYKLESGNTYRAILRSPGSEPGVNYFVKNAGLAIDKSPYKHLTYDGINSTVYINGTDQEEGDALFYISVDTTPTNAISTLSALTGQETGKIDLSWISPNETLTSGSEFIIEYSSWTDTVWSTSSAVGDGYYVSIPTSSINPGTTCYYTIGSLMNSTTYFFRIWVGDEVHNWSKLSNGATAFTLTPPYPQPQHAQVYALGVSSCAIRFDQEVTAEAYILQASTEVGFVPVHQSSSTTDVNFTTLTVTGLYTNTTYYFRVGFLFAPTTEWMLAPLYFSSSTLSSIPGEAAATFTDAGETNITAEWTSGSPANPDWTEYLIECSSVSLGGQVLASSWTVNTSYDFTNLLPNVTYYFQVKSRNNELKETSFLDLSSTHTLCNTPGALSFTSVAETQIDLSWDNSSNSASTVYTVESSSESNTNYQQIYQGSDTSYSHTSLTPNVTYYYRVYATNLDNVDTGYNTPISTHTECNVP
ncbi:MAG: fibronectin type III domain-containing protein, partial [Endomicrobiales bacterium]|nr:fibronectin type III domain-containing protein [Endomicrobiales bacterium]